VYWKASQERINVAMQHIDAFERDSREARFPNIARASVAKGLRQRVLNPVTQDQKVASLCGPAAFFYCLLHCHPDWYAKYVADLYNTGRAQIGEIVITPSSGCRGYRSNPSAIADVDWIALASLRDSENAYLSYSSPDDTAAGITTPGKLANWFQDGGFAAVLNDTNYVFSKGLPTLERAARKLMFTEFICLFINDNMLDPLNYDEKTYHPNHWVVLEAPPPKHDDDDIQFSVYSWGEIRRVPFSGKMTRGDFAGNFYGYVAAIPSYGFERA
jgi:hypothetical protein